MKKEEILAICIEEIQNGKSSLEDCVARYPEIGEALRTRLEIIAFLKPDDVIPTPEFKQRLERRIFEGVQPANGILSRGRWAWPRLVPVRVLISISAVILVLGVAGGGTVYAAQNSLPGDALYPIKTGVENMQLTITPGTLEKANLRLKLVQRRIDEAAQQVELNRDINRQALLTIEQQFDEAIKEINDSGGKEEKDEALSRFSTLTLDQQLKLQKIIDSTPETNKPVLKKALDLTRRGNLVAQVAYANHDFLELQPSVSDESLEVGKFKIAGTVLDIQGTSWNVGGVILMGVHFSGTLPAVGNRVKLEGVVRGNEIYLVKFEVSESSLKPTQIEGQFSGINDNGTVNVGGISLQVTTNNDVSLQPGDNLQLRIGDNEAQLHITNIEDRDETDNSTKISGVLSAIDITTGMITTKVSGARVTINVLEARIETDNGDTIRLSDLSKYIGQDIEIEGLYKKDGNLFARQLHIEEDD